MIIYQGIGKGAALKLQWRLLVIILNQSKQDIFVVGKCYIGKEECSLKYIWILRATQSNTSYQFEFFNAHANMTNTWTIENHIRMRHGNDIKHHVIRHKLTVVISEEHISEHLQVEHHYFVIRIAILAINFAYPFQSILLGPQDTRGMPWVVQIIHAVMVLD